MSTPGAKILVSLIILQEKRIGFLGEMADPGPGKKIHKMILDHITMLEIMETSKKQKHNTGGMSMHIGVNGSIFNG
jgi:hypothetical protein